MRNKVVGWFTIGIALLIAFIVYSFNKALKRIINSSCSHGMTCPMWGSLEFQTNVGIAIIVFILIIGFYLVIFSRDGAKDVKTANGVKREDFENVLKKLPEEERLILQKIIEHEGSVHQSKLVEMTGYSKVKVTRVLDKLEGKKLVERRRRGMTNIVILKQ
jgi:uncharacterized membrane protein